MSCLVWQVYWQGYNFMAGILLLVMEDDEEAAFWTFLAVVRKLLPRVVGATGPSTEILMLDELVRQRHPALIKHLSMLGVPLRTWTAPWVICMFSTSLPPETVLRVWDCVILTSTADADCAELLNRPGAPDFTDAPPAIGADAAGLAPEEIAPNVLVLLCLAVIAIIYKDVRVIRERGLFSRDSTICSSGSVCRVARFR
jgi:hypothetical protein